METVRQPFDDTLVAGDTWSWLIRLRQYTTLDGYSLSYFFVGNGQQLELDSTPNLDPDTNAPTGDFQITATGAQSGALPAGTYTWSMCVFDSAEPPNRTELARGSVQLLANIQTATGTFDGRSWVKQVLDAIKANLLGTASRMEQHYQINGRSLQLMSRKELLELESEFQIRYNRELRDSGQRQPGDNEIKVGFGPRGNRVGMWR